jgi:hypothetical protein
MSGIKGHCLCGKVTYQSTATEPVFTGICHCTTCQKGTGSAFASVVAVPSDSLTVTGTTVRFDGAGDSGNPTHHDFCPVCGSTVTRSADIMAGITMLTVGTLEDASWVRPAMQIYCDSAMPWAPVQGVQSFPKMPG